MKKIFLVKPGWIVSKSDGQEHFIDAMQLMNIYKVPPFLCDIYDERDDRNKFGKVIDQTLIPLTPHYELKTYDEIIKLIVIPKLNEYFRHRTKRSKGV
jgi:hypothetical protein